MLMLKGYLPYVFGASKSLFYDRAWNLGTIYAGAKVVNHRLDFMIKSRENTLDMKLKI